MKKITKGDFSHIRKADSLTHPARFRKLHEGTIFSGYSKDEDVLIFKASDGHYVTIDRGLLEEIMQ